MKRLLYIILAGMLFISCHEKNGGEEETLTYGRTVLVYMAMQNSLGSSGYHKADSAEIAKAMQYIPADDRLLLFIDDAKCPRLYELSSQCAEINKKTGKPNGPKLVKQWATDVSSASAATVTEVLTFMRQEYQSDSYGLVMGSHATGWLPRERGTSGNNSQQRKGPRKTFGIDVGPEGSMSSDAGVAGSLTDQIEIADLASGIAKSGVHLNFLLFDACLMQNIEVDYALRHVTDYVIASPISISAEGAYYTDLVRYGLFSSDAADVCRTYVNYYLGKGSIPYTDGYGTVLSCVKTAGLEGLAQTVQSLLSELTHEGDADAKVEALKQADMDDALNYHTYCYNYYYRPHFYDLVSAFKALGADEQQLSTLRIALADVIVSKGATDSFWIGPGMWTMKSMPDRDDEWCGVSIFIPQQIYTTNAKKCVFGDLNEAYKQTEWCKKVY